MMQRYRYARPSNTTGFHMGCTTLPQDGPLAMYCDMNAAARVFCHQRLCNFSAGFGWEIWDIHLRHWLPGNDQGNLLAWWSAPWVKRKRAR